MAKVVVVEDNVAVRTSLSDFLTLKGHSVSEVGDAVELYQQLAIQKYDVAVVDVNLPHHNGFSITEYLSEKDLCAVIIMTARDAVEDRVRGYSCGADIYMVKPVEPEELAAAITSLTQKHKTRNHHAEKVADDNWKLESESRLLRAPSGRVVSLTTREVAILEKLAGEAGSVVSREELLLFLGEPDSTVGRGKLDTIISRLRSKVRNKCGVELPLLTAHNSGLSLPSSLGRS
nr:response regulator transcription factor [uncultured Cohaesibacter sp.]